MEETALWVPSRSTLSRNIRAGPGLGRRPDWPHEPFPDGSAARPMSGICSDRADGPPHCQSDAGVMRSRGAGCGQGVRRRALLLPAKSRSVARTHREAAMRTHFSEDHRLHFPQAELSGGEFVTPYERPSRIEYVLARLKERGLDDIVAPGEADLAPARRMPAVRVPRPAPSSTTGFPGASASASTMSSTTSRPTRKFCENDAFGCIP